MPKFNCALCPEEENVTVPVYPELLEHVVGNHTGEWQYVCNICDVRCKTRQLLKVHNLSHPDVDDWEKLPCPFDDQPQSTVYVYACPHCGFFKVDRATVDRHLVIEHFGTGEDFDWRSGSVLKINVGRALPFVEKKPRQVRPKKKGRKSVIAQVCEVVEQPAPPPPPVQPPPHEDHSVFLISNSIIEEGHAEVLELSEKIGACEEYQSALSVAQTLDFNNSVPGVAFEKFVNDVKPRKRVENSRKNRLTTLASTSVPDEDALKMLESLLAPPVIHNPCDMKLLAELDELARSETKVDGDPLDELAAAAGVALQELPAVKVDPDLVMDEVAKLEALPPLTLRLRGDIDPRVRVLSSSVIGKFFLLFVVPCCCFLALLFMLWFGFFWVAPVTFVLWVMSFVVFTVSFALSTMP
jgi:transcription elongation factor Elf1